MNYYYETEIAGLMGSISRGKKFRVARYLHDSIEVISTAEEAMHDSIIENNQHMYFDSDKERIFYWESKVIYSKDKKTVLFKDTSSYMYLNIDNRDSYFLFHDMWDAIKEAGKDQEDGMHKHVNEIYYLIINAINADKDDHDFDERLLLPPQPNGKHARSPFFRNIKEGGIESCPLVDGFDPNIAFRVLKEKADWCIPKA